MDGNFDSDDEALDENGWLIRGRDEYGLILELESWPVRKIARSKGFLDWHTIQQRIDLGIPNFAIEKDIWVTNCNKCGIWIFVPLEELGSPTKDLLAGTPTLIDCQGCHAEREWEQSDWYTYDLWRDQQMWEMRNTPDDEDDSDSASEDPVDEAQDYRNLLIYELEWDHGPIGCRSIGFPEWTQLYDRLGEDIATMPYPGGGHVGRCYTCGHPIVIPVAKLRSSLNDRLEPKETLVRCFICHAQRAWENQDLDLEGLVAQQIRFMDGFKQFMENIIDETE